MTPGKLEGPLPPLPLAPYGEKIQGTGQAYPLGRLTPASLCPQGPFSTTEQEGADWVPPWVPNHQALRGFAQGKRLVAKAVPDLFTKQELMALERPGFG